MRVEFCLMKIKNPAEMQYVASLLGLNLACLKTILLDRIRLVA